MAYEYRKRTGKQLSKSKQFQEKIKSGAGKSSYFSAESAREINKINDYANRPILTTTNALDERKIRDARNIILKSLSPSESRKLYNNWIKYDASEQAKKIKVMPFKTVSELEFDKKLSEFTKKINANKNYSEAQKKRLIETFKKTGSASISEQIKKSIKATPKTLSESRKVFDKAVSEAISLPTLNEIATGRDKVLESVGLLETQRRQQAKVMSDPAAKAVLKFTEKEYEEIRTQPATYASEVAALAVVGAGFGAGAKGFSIATKGVSRKVLGKQLAQRAVFGAGTPLVGKIAVEQLPTIALDTFFVSQIGKEVVKGAKVDGKPIAELGGVPAAISAKKAGKDIQWVTEQNLDIAKDLAVMAPFIGVGGKVAEKTDIKARELSKKPEVEKITATTKAQYKKFVEDTSAQLLYESPALKDVARETMYITDSGIIPESSARISSIGIKEDVKLTPEMEEVLFGKPKKVEPPKIDENYKISSVKIGEDVKLTPEMERVLFGKPEGVQNKLLVKIADEKIKNIKNTVPTDYTINSIKAKDIVIDVATVRKTDSVFRSLKPKIIEKKREIAIPENLIKTINKDREIIVNVPKIKPIDESVVREKESIVEIQKISEIVKNDQSKVESAIDKYRKSMETPIKEENGKSKKLKYREDILIPILKIDREISKKLTPSELDKFIRAFRIRKNKLGTLSSMLGGNNKKPTVKRKKPAKTTRKTRRKVTA